MEPSNIFANPPGSDIVSDVENVLGKLVQQQAENEKTQIESSMVLGPELSHKLRVPIARQNVLKQLLPGTVGTKEVDVPMTREMMRRLARQEKTEGRPKEEIVNSALAAFSGPKSLLRKVKQVATKKAIAEHESEIANLDLEIAELRHRKAALEWRIKEAEAMVEAFGEYHKATIPERLATVFNDQGEIHYDRDNRPIIFGDFSADLEFDEIVLEANQLFSQLGVTVREISHDELRERLLVDQSWDYMMLAETYLKTDECYTQSRELYELSGVWNPDALRQAKDALFHPKKPPETWYGLGPYGQNVPDVFNPGDVVQLYVDEQNGKRTAMLYSSRDVALRLQATDDDTSLFAFRNATLHNLILGIAKCDDPPECIGLAVSEHHEEQLRQWVSDGKVPPGEIVPIENNLYQDHVVLQFSIEDAMQGLERAKEREKVRRASEWGKRMREAWDRMVRENPWARGLFPFYLDLKALGFEGIGRVKVEVIQEVRAFLTEDAEDEEELMTFGLSVEWQDPLAAAYRFTLDAYAAEKPTGFLNVSCMHQKEDAASDLDTDSDDRWFIVLTCAMASVVDLLTREIKMVERKKAVDKKIVAHKSLPGIRIDYNPVIYAPRVKRVQVGDGNLVRMQEALERRRQEEERQAREEAERLAQQRVKHKVASFRRNLPPGRSMSLKQRKRLLELEALGVTPVDALGNAIPVPTASDHYTIVLEHERGQLDPEVVSKQVLDLIEAYRKGK